MTSPESKHRQREVLAWRLKDRDTRKSLTGQKRHSLTERQIQSAKSERADGASWLELGRRFGMKADIVKRLVEGTP